MDMWVQQQCYGAVTNTSSGLISKVLEQRRTATVFSLEKWRVAWLSSDARASQSETKGMCAEKAIARYILFKLLFERNLFWSPSTGNAALADITRLSKMLELIKACNIAAESSTGVEESDFLQLVQRVSASPFWEKDEPMTSPVIEVLIGGNVEK